MADNRFPYRGRDPSCKEYPWDEEWNYSSDRPTHPVGMDPNGRRYGMAWSPDQKQNGGCLVQTETYAVHRPALGRYGYAPPNANYRMNSDFVDNSKWHRPPPNANYRMNSDFVDNSKWHRPPPMPSPHYDRPPEVEKFLDKVQVEASQPLGSSPPVTGSWSYNHDPPEYKEHYTRYRNEGGQQAQFGTAPSVRANGVRNPNPVSHGMYPAQPGYGSSLPASVERSTIEPSPAPGLGRRGSSGKVNQYSQPGRDSRLSKPSDDINKLAECLKEAAKPFSQLKPAMPQRDAAPEVSRVEAVKLQNNSKSSLEPESKPKPEQTTADAAHTVRVTSRAAVPTTANIVHTGTITSREAAEMFDGVLM